ncbi:GNAT family N-acetyltransferase [Bacteriovoracaceae bacterium]|nr:GNAT family N-acetyltransferase [Bacteriovoracaceae bacterium]
MIRKSIRSDIDAIVSAQVEMALETEQLTLDPKIVTKGVEALFDDQHKGTYFVFELDSKIVGTLLTLPEWSDWRNGNVLWIHSVWVDRNFRRQGIYRKLYSYMREMVETDPSLRGLRLYVDKTNVSAQKVYESLGMTRDHYHLYEWLK